MNNNIRTTAYQIIVRYTKGGTGARFGESLELMITSAKRTSKENHTFLSTVLRPNQLVVIFLREIGHILVELKL